MQNGFMCSQKRVTESTISLNTQQHAFFALVSQQENARFRKDVEEEVGCHVAVGFLLVDIDLTGKWCTEKPIGFFAVRFMFEVT